MDNIYYENSITNIQQLDKDQEKAFKLLKDGANVFLTGGGGTGKSFV